MLKALSSILLVYAVETFLSALLSSLVLKAIKRQKELGSVLVTVQRLLYVVYIYTHLYTFFFPSTNSCMNFQYYGTRVHVITVMCVCPYLHVLSTFGISHYCNMQLGMVDQRDQMLSVLCFSFPLLPVAIQCIVCFLTSAVIQK